MIHYADVRLKECWPGVRSSPPSPRSQLMSIATEVSLSEGASSRATRADIVRPGVLRLTPYVPGKPIDEVKRELGLPDDLQIYKLASNENVLGPSPKAVEAIRDVSPDIWLYPDDTCFELRNALSRFWDLSPEHFIIGNGSD